MSVIWLLDRNFANTEPADCRTFFIASIMIHTLCVTNARMTFFYPSSMVNLTSLHINFLLHWFTIDTNLFFLMTRHTFHAFLNAYLSKTSPLPWKERRKIGLLQFKQWYRTPLINWLFGKEIQKCKKVGIHMYISCSRINVLNPTF